MPTNEETRRLGAAFKPGDRVRLSGYAIKQGCNFKALGSDLGEVDRVDKDGILYVLVDGQGVPVMYHPSYWERSQQGGIRPKKIKVPSAPEQQD